MRRSAPTWHQRRQHLRLIWAHKPSQLVGATLLAAFLVVVIAMFTLGGAPNASGALFAVALSMAGITGVGLMLTGDAAVILPGCALGGDHVVETARLRIRPPEPADADAFIATLDDDARIENGWTAETEREFIATARSSHHLARDCGQFLIETTAGAVIGYLDARPDRDQPAMHLGWWVAAEARGQGYGAEAVAAMIAALHNAGYEVVVFGMSTSNLANRRIAEKVGAGLVIEQPFRLPNGVVTDSLWFVHPPAHAEALRTALGPPLEVG